MSNVESILKSALLCEACNGSGTNHTPSDYGPCGGCDGTGWNFSADAASVLKEAIESLPEAEGGKDCPTCRQRVPLTRKEMLNKHKVVMLKRAAAHVMTTMENDFMVRDFTEPEDFKSFNFFSHLRLHGLIFRQQDTAGNNIRGRWGITRNGWAFLKGSLQLPAYVMIKNNHIESRSDELVGFSQVWRGEATLQTTFEYFDDDGKPVGIRPMAPAPAVNMQEDLFSSKPKAQKLCRICMRPHPASMQCSEYKG